MIGDDDIVLDLIEYGAMGIEVYHPIHSYNDIKKYEQIAFENKILISGGTDWHGNNNAHGTTYMGMTGLPNKNFDIFRP